MLRGLISSQDKTVGVTQLLLKQLNVRVTNTSVRESLLSHPDYPSLLSISEVLTGWKVENAALQLNGERLLELEAPFLVANDQDNGEFSVVTRIDKKSVVQEDGLGKHIESSLTDFIRDWSGVVLLAEADEQSGERDYAQKRRQELLSMARLPLIIAGFLGVILVLLINWNFYSWQAIALLFAYTAGLLLSLLLLIPQLDGANSLIKDICGFSSKTDCNSILTSSAAKIWGISWAEIGFFYFIGGLSIILFSNGNYSSVPFTVIKWVNFLALPYTFYSIYYQWRIAKTWCVLCLGVQGLLWFTFSVHFISSGLEFNAVPAQSFPGILISYGLPILVWFSIKPFLEKAAQADKWQLRLQQLKNNAELFRTLLHNQKQMPSVQRFITPIILGNPQAEHTITIVTNPFCGPCARTHTKLEQLLEENSSVKAQIIFATCSDKRRTQVAEHFFALQRAGKDVKTAMNAWYEQPVKNYAEWAKKYPVEFIDKAAKESALHCDWCTLANIKLTPTIFIDGYTLPKQYDLSDMSRLINQIAAVESH